MKKVNKIYCWYCGTNNSALRDTCEHCKQKLEPGNHPFLDFLVEKGKDTVRGGFLGYCEKFLKNHLYGTIMTLAIVFTAGAGIYHFTNTNEVIPKTLKEVELKNLSDKDLLIGCWQEEKDGVKTYQEIRDDFSLFDGYEFVDGTLDPEVWKENYDLTGAEYTSKEDGTINKKIIAYYLYDYDDPKSGMSTYLNDMPNDVQNRPWLLYFPFYNYQGLFSLAYLEGALIWEDDYHYKTYIDGEYSPTKVRISCSELPN